MTDRYAVVGNPIGHSLSPRIHGEFARQTRQDLEYGTILAPIGEFVATVDGFRAAGARGLNVTVPFKLDAFAYATSLTERARSAGAVNTLKFDDRAILGDNTDGAGIVADIARLGISLRSARILLMGAGGAARGVVAPLLAEKPALLGIANRTVERARELAERWRSYDVVRGGAYGDFKAERFDIVINATSASLHGEVPALPAGVLDGPALAYDMVYGNRPTPFLVAAKRQGVPQVADGLGMLVAQAAESFFLWRGVRPDTTPVIAMLRGER